MSFTVDSRFVDVDLAAIAKQRGIAPGYKPTGKRFGDFPSKLRGYGDVYPVMPAAQREAEIERLDHEGGIEFLIRWILDQGQEGSCVGNAGTQGLQVLLAKQFGIDRAIQLSAISLYKQIGSGPMSGADVEDGVNHARDVGILPLDTPENRQRFGDKVMPPTGFYNRYPSGWESQAKQFRFRETLLIRNVDELETAGVNGHPVWVGRAGHSILYCRPTRKSGKGYLYANSWSLGWGFAAGTMTGGFGIDSVGLMSSAADYCFALCSAVVPDFYAIGA